MIILTEEDNSIPLYQRIYSQLKEDISNGKLPAHTKIYSKRKMATHLGVSINTVDTAYSQLVSEGFIEAFPKKGYFVCEMDELVLSIKTTKEIKFKLPEFNNIIQKEIKADFATNGVDVENFPFNTWRRLMKNCFNEYDGNILNCSPLQGEQPLRELMAEYLYQSRGVNCTSEQIIIGAGTDNLLQILSYILDNQCTIATENPVYHEAYLFFKRMGHNVFSVPVDNHGIQVSKLKEYNNIAVYITPSHQFPLGITMPISRRIQLLNWTSKENDRYIIEDDYDSEFRYNSKPIPSLQGIDCSGSVIYMGTFSKSIAPSLRISYMVLPEKLLSVFNAKYTGFSSAVSKIDQLVLTEFICKGYYEIHLNRMRKLYKTKRRILLEALSSWGNKIEISGENAGHHIYLRLKSGMTENEMCKRAIENQVKVYPVSPYFINGVPDKYRGTVLIGYASIPIEKIGPGVASLKKAWQI